MREESEELLRDGLHRALLVIDAHGGIQFATRLARTILGRRFPGERQDRLPHALRDPLAANPGEFQVHDLHVRVFHPPDRREVRMLELTTPGGRQPSDFLPLGLKLAVKRGILDQFAAATGAIWSLVRHRPS